VWGGGGAPESSGRSKYYVSFIDDYSKFTWIYLLKFKSEVFQKFQEFQTLVERLFDRIFLSCKQIVVGSMKSLILSFDNLTLLIMFLVLMFIIRIGGPKENIAILSKLDSLFLLMLTCPSSTRMKLFLPLHFSLIALLTRC
jgi:hypothetical protein